MRAWSVTLLFVFVGCGGGSEPGVCESLCLTLVGECASAAFPDRASCDQGCLYSAELGADVTGQAACVADAGCDPFSIVECEHAHGASE